MPKQRDRVRMSEAEVAQMLAAMRRGQFLQLQYRAGRPLWSLSDGRSVSAEVAETLKNASVAPAGRALFPDMPAKTWRFNP